MKTQRKKGYEYLFSELIRQKTMKQESFVNEYQLLAERMINYSNTWMYASSLYDNKLSQAKIIVDQAFQLQLMFYPFLTKRGRRDFEALHCYIKK